MQKWFLYAYTVTIITGLNHGVRSGDWEDAKWQQNYVQ